jgi:hypothetical protein
VRDESISDAARLSTLALTFALRQLANERKYRQSTRTMDIESFISQALQQLGAGIEKARKTPNGQLGIEISPTPYMDEGSNTAGGRLIDSRTNAIINFVEFDLSVVVTKRVEGGGEAKAKAKLLQVIDLDFGGAELKGGIDHTRVQRIKFQVPVSFAPPP